jgi:hypothetical protein
LAVMPCARWGSDTGVFPLRRVRTTICSISGSSVSPRHRRGRVRRGGSGLRAAPLRHAAGELDRSTRHGENRAALRH